ncbi:MAG: head-tail connector protein [Clostridia bacterium]|nr:head-tail connector protein [Clostridia bacterium]
MFINLNETKKHLYVDSGFTEDDEYILGLIEVAEQVVEEHIDCKLIDLCDLNEDGQVDLTTLPAPLKHAMKLFVGNLYANRESIAFAQSHELPLSFKYLINLYKNYESRTTK